MSEEREQRREELSRGRLARALAAPLGKLADRGWGTGFLRGGALGLRRAVEGAGPKQSASGRRGRVANQAAAGERGAPPAGHRNERPRIGIEGGAVRAAAPLRGAAAVGGGSPRQDGPRRAGTSVEASAGDAAQAGGGIGLRLAQALQGGRVAQAGVALADASGAPGAGGARAARRGRYGRAGRAGAPGERGAPGAIGVRLSGRGPVAATRRDTTIAVSEAPARRESRGPVAPDAAPMRLTGLERVEDLLSKLRSGGERGSRGATQSDSTGGVGAASLKEATRHGGERGRADAGPAVVVNYAPSVSVENRSEQGLERRLLEVLERHGYELAEVMGREAAKRRRGEF